MSVEVMRAALDALRVEGWVTYGATMSADEFRRRFEVTRRDDEELEDMAFASAYKLRKLEELAELEAADFVRQVLLKEGMYLERRGQQYRIALPSENAAVAEQYLDRARRASRKADLLLKSTPVAEQEGDGMLAVRLLRQRDAEARMMKRARGLEPAGARV